MLHVTIALISTYVVTNALNFAIVAHGAASVPAAESLPLIGSTHFGESTDRMPAEDELLGLIGGQIDHGGIAITPALQSFATCMRRFCRPTKATSQCRPWRSRMQHARS